ncbi:MAG TPA: hypothetical protein VEI97_20230 [bacterium]|nr:hypothetical protein [bacterium]
MTLLVAHPVDGASSSSNLGFAVGDEVLYLIQPTEEAKIALFDAQGKWITSAGTEEPGQPDSILAPVELLTDAGGNCYVLDQFGPSIVVVSPEGRVLRRFGTRGFDKGQMRQPVDFGIDGTGTIYVLDLGREVVLRFNTAGHMLGEVDLDPEDTLDIHWSKAIGVGSEGDFVLAADDPDPTVLRKLNHFDKYGDLESTLTLGKIEGVGQITDVAILPDGGLLFTDSQPLQGRSYTGAVYRVTPSGDFGGRVFIKDPIRGARYSPVRAKAVGDRLFVLTSTNLVCQVDLEGNVLLTWGAGELG